MRAFPKISHIPCPAFGTTILLVLQVQIWGVMINFASIFIFPAPPILSPTPNQFPKPADYDLDSSHMSLSLHIPCHHFMFSFISSSLNDKKKNYPQQFLSWIPSSRPLTLCCQVNFLKAGLWFWFSLLKHLSMTSVLRIHATYQETLLFVLLCKMLPVYAQSAFPV